MSQPEPDPNATPPQPSTVDPAVSVDKQATEAPKPVDQDPDKTLTPWDLMHPNSRELTW